MIANPVNVIHLFDLGGKVDHSDAIESQKQQHMKNNYL